MASGDTLNASLLTPSHIGGLIGGRGYNFQDAYIVSRIPVWLSNPSFSFLLQEGIGDVEIRFDNCGGTKREHYQIKNHHVASVECRDVIAGFFEKHKSSPDTYSAFFLACPSLGRDVEIFRHALERLQQAGPMFGTCDKVLQDTERDVLRIAKRLNITAGLDFLVDKLHFDTGMGDLRSDVRHCNEFAGAIRSTSPQFESASSLELSSGYRNLCHFIAQSIGIAQRREMLVQEIQRAINASGPRLEKDGVLVRLFHWEDPSFDLSQEWDVLLDWSELFDRNIRKVPPPDVWSDQLLPELLDGQKRVRMSTNSRRIRFRPSACLSAGIALGWAFSEVKGYTFEIQQGAEVWKTDEEPSTEQHIQIAKELELDHSSTDLCVEVSQFADVGPKVDQYLRHTRVSFRARLCLTPQEGIGKRINGATALAFSHELKQLIRQAVVRYECSVVHLFYAGPLGLAVFMGRLFNAIHADVQCYEEQPNTCGYTPTCLLPTAL
ncbi:MAG: SAVED domain-containing protein [Nitrospirae bacterium]|nr:SAVED domain-containing protein [Nitrospirota bacterium]